MADLMKGVTTYLVLSKKYENFQAPSVRIEVDGNELNEKLSAGVDRVLVELTSEYQASGCTFIILNAYDEKETSFSKKLSEKIVQLGSQVSVSVGYVKREEVFSGYISAINYLFDADISSPYIKVECMDVKGLMMKNQRLKIFKEDSIKQAVSKVLSEQPYSSYIKGKTIEDSKFTNLVISTRDETDYEFIVREAKRTGYEFFVFKSEVFFRTEPSAGSSIMKLSSKDGLLSADLCLDSATLVDKVTVKSVDPIKNTVIEGNATIKGSFGKTASAKKIIGNTCKVYYEPDVKTAQDAKTRAEILIDQHASRFGTISCTCVGIPEIVPGRFIDIEGLMPMGDKTYYVTSVTHELSEEGFTTSFEARIKKL